MYHDLPRTARFWSFLLAIDQDLAEETRKKACPCGGRLHSANYLTKATRHPRPASRARVPETELLLRSRRLQEEGDTAVGALPRAKGLPGRHRHPRSAPCGKGRPHAGSVSFPHASAPTAGPSPAGRSSGANTFPKTPFWKIARARLVPVVKIISLPYSLVDAFLGRHPRCRGWTLLLRFLSPITIPGGLRIELSR